MQCEGFLCQLFHYPPIGHEPVACTHACTFSFPPSRKGRAGTVIISRCLWMSSPVQSEGETVLDAYEGLGPSHTGFP